MTDQESTEFYPSDVETVARHWRKDWSDRSRSEMVISKGPAFFFGAPSQMVLMAPEFIIREP